MEEQLVTPRVEPGGHEPDPEDRGLDVRNGIERHRARRHQSGEDEPGDPEADRCADRRTPRDDGARRLRCRIAPVDAEA